MPDTGAQLSISVAAADEPLSVDLEFFNSEHWDAVAESDMIEQLHDLLACIRPRCKKIKVSISVEVENYALVSAALHKKLKKECVINHQKLSIREMEVLGLIMQGFTNKKISEKLFISYETVKSHRKNILEKTGAPNTAALINYYHQTFFDK